MPEDLPYLSELERLGKELERRGIRARLLDRYIEGECPMPKAIRQARVTKAYKHLMGVSDAPWGSLICGAVQDRLQITGIRTGDAAVDQAIWGQWQDNSMDSESKLAHDSALNTGRAFATVWPNEDDDPEITLDGPDQMIVEYRDGRRRPQDAIQALRFWTGDGDRPKATLYRPDGIFKYQGTEASLSVRFSGITWEKREEPEDEEWPVENPYDVVPVVELRVNGRLKPGSFPFARGEYEHCLGLIDRISLLTFLGLVVAFWMGFPVRGVIGEKVMKDDNGEIIAPFDVNADELFQLENKDAKLAEYKAADRKNLSVFAEIDQLSSITATPRHYFPLENGMSNLSADAIRASEGSLVAKVPRHKDSLGEGWEAVLRLAGMMSDEEIEVSQRAELQWTDHESRSMAERADAATKLASLDLPGGGEMIAEKYLNWTQEEIARGRALAATGAFGRLLDEVASQPTAPEPVAA